MFDINFRIGDRMFKDFFAVPHIVDRVVLLQADERGVLTEQSRAKTMKRSSPSKVAGRKFI